MAKTLSSPLVAAANNIVSIGNQSTRSLVSIENDYSDFLRFLKVKRVELDNLKLPDKNKINQLANIDVASNFGSPGGLLSNLASGALDVAGFLGNMFPSKGKMGRPEAPGRVRAPSPEVEGSRLKFGGLRSIGIANAIFAGLDFATGLAEGESVGKSAAGAGGALAGGLLGGAIGQALIPIPGVGFVIGDMAGSFLGGWGADRLYEGVTGEKSLEEKQAERIKAQESAQKALVGGKGSFSSVVNKFNDAVSRFEMGVAQGLFGSMEQEQDQPMESSSGDVNTSYNTNPDQVTDPGTTYTAEGGDKPSSNFISPFGVWRGNHQHMGVDFANPSPTAPVSVIQPGTVDTGFDGGGYGNWVAVKHENGAETFYGHLSKVNVVKGQKIEAGTVIGNQGSTGHSTGPHVHFEYRPGGPGTKAVDGRGVADSYFRFGGNVKTKKGAVNTDANKKLGDVDTNYQQTQQTQQTQQKITATPSANQLQQTSNPPQPQMMQQMQPQSSVAPAQMNLPTPPQNIQYYPSYNQAGGASVIMPILMGGGGGAQQKPVLIPAGGGGGGGTVIMPGPTEGQVVNSLMKTILLTNLLGT